MQTRDAHKLLELPRAIRARFGGTCAYSGLPFGAGAEIRNYDFGWVANGTLSKIGLKGFNPYSVHPHAEFNFDKFWKVIQKEGAEVTLYKGYGKTTWVNDGGKIRKKSSRPSTRGASEKQLRMWTKNTTFMVVTSVVRTSTKS